MSDLHDDEYEIEEALTDASFTSVEGVEARIAASRVLAERSVKKNKAITIRMSDSDIHSLKRIAANEGIPYQTLISSVLHKIATGEQPL